MSQCELLTHTLSVTVSAFTARRCLFDRPELEVKHVVNTQRPLYAKVAQMYETLLLLLFLRKDYLNAEGAG